MFAVCSCLGLTVQSFAGFGGALVSLPLMLAAGLPHKTAIAAYNLQMTAMVILLAFEARKHIRWTSLLPIQIGGVCTVTLGTYLLHLAGKETITLVVSGVGLLAHTTWAPNLFLVSAGMLLYTAIVSPGYFAQKGQWIWVLIFGGIILISVISIFLIC